MTFKQWFRLQEVGSSTSCVATFSLPLGAGVESWPPSIKDSEWKSPHEQKDKKHHKKKDK